MDEIVVKIEMPHELKELFKLELARAFKNFIIDLEFSIADSILSKSKLTDEKAEQLVIDVDKKVAKRLGL